MCGVNAHRVFYKYIVQMLPVPLPVALAGLSRPLQTSLHLFMNLDQARVEVHY